MNAEAVLVLILLIFFVIGIILKRGSDIDVTVKRSKALEARLKQELNAKGDGLGQLANSIKGKVPSQMSTDLDKIVGMRNPVVHIKYYDTLVDRQEFEQLCDRVESQLDAIKTPGCAQIALAYLLFFMVILLLYMGMTNSY